MVRRVGLASVVLAWAGSGGCTKVNEQPALPPQVAPVASHAVAKKVVRPVPRVWQTQTGFGSASPSLPVRPAATPDAGPVASDTLNGDPNGLKQEVLQKALDGLMPRFSTCFESTEGSVNVGLSFEVDPSGRTTNLKVSGAGAAERCVAGVVSSVQLPSFSGRPVPVQFPLSIHRAASSKPAPAAQAVPEPARAAAPPVFVNP
jgi:hypothetical protein